MQSATSRQDQAAGEPGGHHDQPSERDAPAPERRREPAHAQRPESHCRWCAMSGWLERHEEQLVADDQLAITAHLAADASTAHRFLARQIWHTAQALGVPAGGHVLATGL